MFRNCKAVDQKTASPGTRLLTEGGPEILCYYISRTGGSIKEYDGKNICRFYDVYKIDYSYWKLRILLTRKYPVSESTVSVVKVPAFGIGEFSLVLDDAKRTSHVTAMTDIQYGILSLEDFSNIVQKNPSIGEPVYFEVAKSAVNNLATVTQDISNLTQAFFFALTR